MRLKNILGYRIPKNCILCEQWVFFKIPLCKSCRKFMYFEYKKCLYDSLNIFDHKCIYLWKWDKTTDFWVQKIIVALKNGHNYEVYKLLMSWLTKKINLDQDLNSNKILVTAIPSQDRDHPEYLVKALNHFYPGIKSIELKKHKAETQKNKTRFERLNTEFSISKAPLDFKLKGKKVIVLDDVLSTGGSFKGMIRALKGAQVQFISVWAFKAPIKSLNTATKANLDCYIDEDLNFDF